MCSWRDALPRAGAQAGLALALMLAAVVAPFATPAAAQGRVAGSTASTYEGIGRPATPKEIAAWDIDVRPDFKGLPPGRGSVKQGQVIWEAKCESCHGIFGESVETFTPLIGGTTAADVASGRVARLTDAAFPGRTTLMKLPTLSTLWDYIHRAMPWNAPKSLSHDEVYAVTAFMLNLGGVVPENFVLGHDNMRQAQNLLPNRAGMSTDHGLWPGRGFGRAGVPDVSNTACMSRCAGEPIVASFIPDYARNAHGNLAEQNRGIGPQRGVDTSAPSSTEQAPLAQALVANTARATPSSTATTTAALATSAAAEPSAVAALALARKHNCLACHAMDRKLVGPALREVGPRHAARSDATDYLARAMTQGSSGVWGAVAMPAQPLSPADARTLAAWLARGAP